MNCTEIQDSLSAWLDGESSAAESLRIEDHLPGCRECSEMADRLRMLEQSLRTQLNPQPEQLTRLADRIATELDRPATRPVLQRKQRREVRWIALASVVLLLAIVFVPLIPWNEGQDQRLIPIGGGPLLAPLPIAQLVHVIGPVSIRTFSHKDWQPLAANTQVSTCYPGTHLRTEAGGLCEVVTTCGNLLRLNQSTEISLVSTTDVALISGEVWCRTPADCQVRMLPPASEQNVDANLTQASLPAFTCPVDAACVTTANENHPFQILAAAGELEISQQGETHRLNPGDVYRLAADGPKVQPRAADPLIAQGWMQPLLALKPAGDGELEDWVSRLLAQLGETKISYLSESQLRQLGPAGAEPLLRFVQRENAPADKDRRRRAAAILRDVAPVSMTGSLIELLSDADPVVRTAAAEALRRLHQEDFGVTAAQWEAGGPETEAAIQKWRELGEKQ